jgi:cytochrome c6
MRADFASPTRTRCARWPASRVLANFGKKGRAIFPKAGCCTLPLLLLALWLPDAARAGDVIKGAQLYRQHCSSCHGTGGRPQMVGAPDFSQPTALLKPDMTLLQSIRAGKGAMPAYQGLLRDRDLLDIVAHLRTLR